MESLRINVRICNGTKIGLVSFVMTLNSPRVEEKKKENAFRSEDNVTNTSLS